MAIYLQPALSFELTDLIIDNVAEYDYKHVDHTIADLLYNQDREGRIRPFTLNSCSLVARSWLPRSRHHLFQRVDLDCLSESKFVGFLDFLDSPYSTIAPHVRQLSLYKKPGPATSMKPSWLNDHLPRLMALAAIESLLIDDGKLGLLSTQTTTCFFESFSRLHKLDISFTKFADMSQLSHALSVLHQLKKLSISSCQFVPASRAAQLSLMSPSVRRSTQSVFWSPDPSNSAHTSSDPQSDALEKSLPSPPTSLTSLDVQYFTTHELVEILEWLVPGPSIEILRIQTVTAAQSPAVATYLRALGPSLKQLDVGVWNSSPAETDAQDAFCRAVDLGQNPNLHTICFTSLSISTDRENHHTAALHIPPLLAQITTYNIREVKLNAIMGIADDFGVIDWDAIEKIISRPNYSRLERLVIYGPDGPDNILAETRRWIANRLPVTQARGIIFCE